MKLAFFGDTGYVGTREWVAYLAASPGIDLHAIVLEGSPREITGVTFHVMPRQWLTGKAAYITCIPALRKILRRVEPDVLIAYRVVSYGFSASMTGFHPLVLAAQGQFIVSRETPRFFRHFASRAIRRADMIHAWAPPMAENLVKLGADPARILVLPRGVDDERYHPGPEPPPPLTLVTTRKIEPYYNFPTLLDAIRMVRERVGEVRWLIAGEGSQRPELEARCREMGIEDSVTFLGPVSRDALPGLMRASHLYVSAVPSDGTSSSLLEAMASGVPTIVAANESNAHWIRDGETGRMVPAFDAESFAGAIVDAWERPDWRRKVAEAGIGIVRARASWKRNMARFVEAYRGLAEGRMPAVLEQIRA